MRKPLLWMTSLLILVAGCGQRGDLYFPEEEREAVITVPAQGTQPGTAPAATPEEEADDTAAQPGATQPGAIAPPAPGDPGR